MVADIMGGNSTDGAAPSARPEIVLMRAAMAKLRRRVADLEAFDPNRIENRKDASIETLAKAIDSTLREVFGADTPEYERYSAAKHLDTAPFLLNGTPMALVRTGLEQGKTMAIALLDQAIGAFEESIAEGKAIAAPRPRQPRHRRPHRHPRRHPHRQPRQPRRHSGSRRCAGARAEHRAQADTA